MPNVNPKTLRYLRKRKGWSQDDLARNAKLDKSAIYRIEAGKSVDPRTHTVKKLTSALGVTAEELASENSISAVGNEVSRKSQMNLRVADEVRNALTLVAKRYEVSPSDIVHLAPFLFVWAAEASLKQRRERLDALALKWSDIGHASDFPHLTGVLTYNWRGEEVMDEEQRSIDAGDIFGRSLSGDAIHPRYEESEHNPMVTFLKGLAEQTDGVAQFNYWSTDWDSPGYIVGRHEALALFDGDEDAANHVLSGYVGMHTVPKEVWSQGAQAAAEWVKRKAEEFLAEEPKIDIEAMLEGIEL